MLPLLLLGAFEAFSSRLDAQELAPDSSVTAIMADSARPAEELRQASLRYQGSVRTCYEQEGLRQDPTLRGEMEVSFTILPTGAITELSVDTLHVRGIGMREVVACVTAAASSWHFSQGDYPPERTLLAFTFIAPAERAQAAPGQRDGSSAPPA